jgi:hypothetical protein
MSYLVRNRESGTWWERSPAIRRIPHGCGPSRRVSSTAADEHGKTVVLHHQSTAHRKFAKYESFDALVTGNFAETHRSRSARRDGQVLSTRNGALF